MSVDVTTLEQMGVGRGPLCAGMARGNWQQVSREDFLDLVRFKIEWEFNDSSGARYSFCKSESGEQLVLCRQPSHGSRHLWHPPVNNVQKRNVPQLGGTIYQFGPFTLVATNRSGTEFALKAIFYAGDGISRFWMPAT
ncbi:hypothetical protein B0J11DRAFT_510856 [Dendryphion nanum]|uniref:Uncharacterized protein n=1 Tax=Dendryphion nanum TaxID=256645 RepID=A0A9P9ICW1_9PLEO|nr:hypothetical protein B0J11DRAFT_510856 [Dendryphion nanum]